MKTYVITTGLLFGVLVAVHVWRMIEEGPGLARDPAYLLITAAAGALSLWAWGVLRRSNRP